MSLLRVITLVLVAVSRVDSVRPVKSGTQHVTLGTFAAIDETCLTKKLFRRQPEPQTINFIATTNIQWIKITPAVNYRKGTITATVAGGGLGTPSISLIVGDTNSKSYFLNDVLVEMRCGPVVLILPIRNRGFPRLTPFSMYNASYS